MRCPWGGADDRHPGLAKRCFWPAAGGTRVRRQQEDQGHQAPCPELLAGLRPGRRLTPASVHDTKAAEMVLERAVENGFTIARAKVDAIYTGPTIEAVSGLHKVEFQVSSRETGAKGFAPLPLRWRIEATFGTATNRYRRLTRNLEQHAKSA